MKFREVPLALRPTSEAGGNTRIAAGASPDRDMIDSVIDRWRASTMSKGQFDDDGPDAGSWRDEIPVGREEAPRYQSAPPTQPAAPEAPRPSILRRPIPTEPPGPNNPAPLPSRYRTPG
jgi:hypothetical protein